MADRTLRFVLKGEDQSASSTMARSADNAEKSARRIGSSFTHVGSLIGGEFGEVFTKLGEGFDAVAERGGKGLASKLLAGGTAVAALGGTLTMFGSSRKASEEQLKVAIEASGHAYEDYAKQIEGTIKSQENFGHGEKDTELALRNLTTATQDPQKALQDMGVVSNLAAAQHESLAAAATQLARVYGGSGRVLKQYGITMESAKGDAAALKAATNQHTAAVDALSKAQERLTQLTEIDRAKTSAGHKLTLAEQIALKNAHDAVAAAQEKVRATTDALSKAQANNKTQTQTADDAIHKLSDRLQGQASAAANTWGGKIDAIRAKLSDFAAMVGQKYGPAITSSSTLFLASAGVVDMWGKRQDAAAAKAAEFAAKQDEAAARVQAAAESEQLSASQVAIAEQRVADSVTASTMEQKAALAELTAAREAATAAAVESDAARVAADEAAGTASSMAFGPIGIAVGAVVTAGTLAAGALGLFGRKAHEQIKPTQDLTNAILEDNNALGNNTRKLTENSLEKAGAYDTALKLGVSQKTLTDAVLGNADAQKQLSDATGVANAVYDANLSRIIALNPVMGTGNRLAEARRDAYDQMTQAEKDAFDASAKLQGVIKTETDTLNVNKRAADNIAAADGRVAAAHGGVTGAAQQAARATQLATDKANAYRAAVKNPIYAHLDAEDRVSAVVGAAEGRLESFDGRTVTAYLNVQERRIGTGAGLIGMNAGGNDFFAGGRTYIAEREPEIVSLPRGSQITPVSKMKFSGGAASAVPVNVHLYVQTLTTDAASQRALVSALEGAIQTGLKIRGLSDAAA